MVSLIRAPDDLIDLAINQTLSRTLLTSVTTLLALLSLFFFGGPVLQSFTAAMIWGIFVGTYSSVFIAAPILIYLGLKQGAEVASTALDGKLAQPAE